MTKKVSPGTCGGVRQREHRHNGFTLIELALVVGIIIVLAGLILSTVGYARKKGALARAETEIAAMRDSAVDEVNCPIFTRHG